eukprot:SAG11_NODE_274_length_11310_cov_4.717510_14_plen_67_part_01
MDPGTASAPHAAWRHPALAPAELHAPKCRFRVTTQVKTWDVPDGEAPGRAAIGRRVPDIIAVDPENN